MSGHEPKHVLVAPELVAILSRDWSQPVSVRIDSEHGAELRLVFETYGHAITRADVDFIAQLSDYSWDRAVGEQEHAAVATEIARKESIVGKLASLLPPETP